MGVVAADDVHAERGPASTFPAGTAGGAAAAGTEVVVSTGRLTAVSIVGSLELVDGDGVGEELPHPAVATTRQMAAARWHAVATCCQPSRPLFPVTPQQATASCRDCGAAVGIPECDGLPAVQALMRGGSGESARHVVTIVNALSS